MECTFSYGDMTFTSELALDEYLILTKMYKNESDVVFNKPLGGKQQAAVEAIKTGHKLGKDLGIVGNVECLTDDEVSDLDPILNKGRSLGITSMIQQLLKDNGKHITPLYNEENYWMNRKKQLVDIKTAIANGWVTEYDIPFLFQKKVDQSSVKTQEITSLDGPYDIHDIKDENEFKMIRERMTKVWAQQAIIGTGIHDIFSWYLSQPRPETLSTEFMISQIKVQLNSQALNYFSNQNLIDILKHCQEFKQKVQAKWPGCYLMPEQQLTSDAVVNGEDQSVVGRLDLIVVDKEGGVHIIDFKCSPKNYEQYNSAKKLTFQYQLESYRRMIRKLGLNISMSSGLYVVPLQMVNFEAEWGTNLCKLDGIHNDYEDYLLELKTSETVKNEMDKVFRDDYIDDLSTNGIAVGVEEFMKIAFPEYAKDKNLTDEYIQERIDKADKIKDEVSGKIGIQLSKNGELITANSEPELFKKVKQHLESNRKRKDEQVQHVKYLLKEGQKTTDHFNLDAGDFGKGNIKDPKKGSDVWLQNILGKYANSRYMVVEGSATEILDKYGIILVKERHTGLIDIIKVSTQDLKQPKPLAKGKYLLSTFRPDIVQTNDPNSLAMESVQGNIEMIETMAALNQIPGFFTDNKVIGNIQVVNVYRNAQQGLQSTNKQLLWNFNQLCKEVGKAKGSPIQNNFVQYGQDYSKGIKMATYAQLAQLKLKDILLRDNLGSGYQYLKSVNLLDEGIPNKFSTLGRLLSLKRAMEEKHPGLATHVDKKIVSDEMYPEVEVYNNVMMAIAEVQGINLTQQVDDHDKYYHELSLKAIVQNGINGNYTDNPGTLKSQNLNKLAELTARAYQNSRQSITAFNAELQKRLNKLKEAKGFGYLQKITFGNQTKLYSNMYDPIAKKNGELKFKNPFDVSSEMTDDEREFLQFALHKIVEDKSGMTFDSEDEFMQEFNSRRDEYLLVPLCRGSFSSELSSAGGLIEVIKNKFKRLMPKQPGETWEKVIKKHVSDKLHGFFKDSDTKSKVLQGEMFEMTNQFDASLDPEARNGLLMEYGVDYFEQNLEKLLLRHKAAYTLKTEMDKVFPLLKAIIIHISTQGIVQNTEFVNDLQYAYDYIKNKIFNQPLQDSDNMTLVTALANELMSATSKLALAFNPKQLYQFIDGIWKDVMLVIQQPDKLGDANTAFTKQNMKDSFMWIMQDIGNFGNTKSLGELLNELYGINDMDMNTYTDRIDSDNVGIFNFWSLAFRFASRPDYYNRMTIFGAQMRADGSFEAHSVVDGKLVYDWKKDKRFSKFAADPHKKDGDTEYQKQKALYYRMAEDFKNEQAKNADGTPFDFTYNGDPPSLPRAYTLRQSESMKALGDKIYGYYAHEKKSMIQATTLGAMFMQMNTFWSSKKNQYLSGHGFTQQGAFVQYIENEGTDDEVRYYQRLDENGNLEQFGVKKGETPPPNSMPFVTWKGRPCEGIVVTLGKVANDIMIGDTETGDKGWNYMMKHIFDNENPDLRNLYRANMSQLLYDLFMLLFLGCLVAPALANSAKSYAKETGNANFGQAMINNTALLSTAMLQQSADDFNMVNSIFGRAVNWTPFSLAAGARLVNNFGQVLSDDKDVYDALINSASATRQTKPIWDFVKINSVGRSIGEKTPTV